MDSIENLKQYLEERLIAKGAAEWAFRAHSGKNHSRLTAILHSNKEEARKSAVDHLAESLALAYISDNTGVNWPDSFPSYIPHLSIPEYRSKLFAASYQDADEVVRSATSYIQSIFASDSPVEFLNNKVSGGHDLRVSHIYSRWRFINDIAMQSPVPNSDYSLTLHIRGEIKLPDWFCEALSECLDDSGRAGDYQFLEDPNWFSLASFRHALKKIKDPSAFLFTQFAEGYDKVYIAEKRREQAKPDIDLFKRQNPHVGLTNALIAAMVRAWHNSDNSVKIDALMEEARSYWSNLYSISKDDATSQLLAAAYGKRFPKLLSDLPKLRRSYVFLLVSSGISKKEATEIAKTISEKHEKSMREAKEKEAEEKRVRDQWRASLLYAKDIPKKFGLTSGEVQYLIDKHRIPVAREYEFSKWGRYLTAHQYDPAVIEKLQPQFEKWLAPFHREAEKKRKAGIAKAQKTRAANKEKLRAARMEKSRVKKAIEETNIHAYFSDYPSLFPDARALKRHFIIYCGPTNSGKTHQCLDRLAEAGSGVSLSPLRLLAQEHRQSLIDRGIPTDLRTGEEVIEVENATHVCSTVEMLDSSVYYDIALIDEAQMLSDPGRGQAWTRAICGVHAPIVLITCAPEGLTYVQNLISTLGDSFEVIKTKRLGSLEFEKSADAAYEIRKGDALICFSRADVFKFRKVAEDSGHSVSVIYGGLSPENRRTESERFLNGETDVVVATDAIGMGLNLPISRVVFTTQIKYDGVSERRLHPFEIRQIAGRAGRYAQKESGLVNIMEKDSDTRNYVKQALSYKEGELGEPSHYPISPDAHVVGKLSDILRTSDLDIILSKFREIQAGDARWQCCDISERLEVFTSIVAPALRHYDTKLDMSDIWRLCHAPVSIKNSTQSTALNTIISKGLTVDSEPIKPEDFRLGIDYLADFESADSSDLESAESMIKAITVLRGVIVRFPSVAYLLNDLAFIEYEIVKWIKAVLNRKNIPIPVRYKPRYSRYDHYFPHYDDYCEYEDDDDFDDY